MTTLALLQASADLKEHASTNPRTQAIDEHDFDLNLAYLNARIGHLPGPPSAVKTATPPVSISRGSLFAMAAAAGGDETNEAA